MDIPIQQGLQLTPNEDTVLTQLLEECPALRTYAKEIKVEYRGFVALTLDIDGWEVAVTLKM